jgi:hypothetical protein
MTYTPFLSTAQRVRPDDEIAVRDAQCQNLNEEHFGAGIFGEVDK